MKEIEGDLLELARQGNFDLIVHGCNCFCAMGSGIAKQIKEQFPLAWAADAITAKGDIKKLGTYTSSLVHYPFIIINAYTQYNYGVGSVRVDYEALTLIMRKLNHIYPQKRIGLPKIGAGLAGGDWNRIKQIILYELKDMDVTLVHYKQK